MSYWAISRKIYLIRHSETLANQEGIVVGKSDSELTERGRAQVKRVASLMSEKDFDHLFSSPLKRTRTLADAILEAKLSEHGEQESRGLEGEGSSRSQIAIVEVEDITEIDFGAHEGLLYRDLPRGPQLSEDEYYVRKMAEGGESRKDLDERVARFVEVLKELEGDAVVVTHGGPLRSIFTQMLGLRREDAWNFDVSNASIFTLALIGERWALHELVVNE